MRRLLMCFLLTTGLLGCHADCEKAAAHVVEMMEEANPGETWFGTDALNGAIGNRRVAIEIWQERQVKGCKQSFTQEQIDCYAKAPTLADLDKCDRAK